MNRISLLLFLVLFACHKCFAETNEFVLSVGELPNKAHLAFANSLIPIFNDLYPEKKIRIQSYPFARSIQSVMSGDADAHMPLFRSDIQEQNLEFSYSTRSYSEVVLVIYSNKQNPITKEKLKEAKLVLKEQLMRKNFSQALIKKLQPLLNKNFDSVIELRRALKLQMSEAEFANYADALIRGAYPFDVGTLLLGKEIFSFPISLQSSMESTLKMVDSRRLDAAILTQDGGDKLVRSLKLKNIHRSLYSIPSVYFVVAKNEKGKNADAILKKVIDEMHRRGNFEKLTAGIHETSKYNDWQP